MVRWIWQNRLVQGARRYVRLFARWVLVWLSYWLRRAGRNVRVLSRVMALLVRPKDPNNLFVTEVEPSQEATEAAMTAMDPMEDEARATLLWSGSAPKTAEAPDEIDASALSLWHGQRKTTAEDAAPGAEAANRRYSYVEVLAAQVKKLNPKQIEQLDEMIERLARKWLDIDERFEAVPRRNKLDVGGTLRYNIPRYAGRILNFKWATKERPTPQLATPARILVIGDVSHSMVHYVSVVLYYLHKLTFHFLIDSYVFSERATHSAPFLNGLGSFAEKVQRLVAGANSWNAGTRFGTALEEIAQSALVDENTYVIIATDGKVSLQGNEPNLIERYMKELRRRAKQVIFLTPSAEFSDGATGKVRPEQVGSLKYDFFEIPIFSGPPVWYGTLGQYADRIYLIRTVQDLIDMTEDLIFTSHQHE